MDQNEIENYIKAGKIAANAIRLGLSIIREGEKAEKIADEIEYYIMKNNAGLAFPVNLSINDEAAHYSPEIDDDRVFKKNDIVKLDLGAHIEGYIADTAVTLQVGMDEKSALLKASEDALKNVIKAVRPGISLGEIGRIIENSIYQYGFKPIYNLTGHQLKKYILHAGISIPNYDDGNIKKIDAGMAFAIEPFATEGVGFVKEGKFGNIMQIISEDYENKDVFEKYRTLPFCTRWIYRDFSNPKEVIDKLLNNKNVYKFPILKEKKKGMVSQFEHTFVVTSNEVYVTTFI
ncbi:MAG: type II methionyl aminopeptidase [Thermoplasmata archaeon]